MTQTETLVLADQLITEQAVMIAKQKEMIETLKVSGTAKDEIIGMQAQIITRLKQAIAQSKES